MGWASTLEDIEEKEAELKYAFGAASTKIRSATNYLTIKNAQEEVQSLADQVANHIDRRLTEILATFDALREALRDPGANLAGRIEKLEKENRSLKKEKKQTLEALQDTRNRRDELQRENSSLKIEMKKVEDLREEIKNLKAAQEGNELWADSTSDVNPLRR